MSEPTAEYKSQTINEIIQSDADKSIEIGRLKAKLEIVEKDLKTLKEYVNTLDGLMSEMSLGMIETILNHIRQ